MRPFAWIGKVWGKRPNAFRWSYWYFCLYCFAHEIELPPEVAPFGSMKVTTFELTNKGSDQSKWTITEEATDAGSAL